MTFPLMELVLSLQAEALVFESSSSAGTATTVPAQHSLGWPSPRPPAVALPVCFSIWNSGSEGAGYFVGRPVGSEGTMST